MGAARPDLQVPGGLLRDRQRQHEQDLDPGPVLPQREEGVLPPGDERQPDDAALPHGQAGVLRQVSDGVEV